MVSTSAISTSTNFRAIGIKLVPVEFLPNCYVVKLVLVEIGYVVPTSNIFFIVRYFPNPKNRTKQGPHVLVKANT